MSNFDRATYEAVIKETNLIIADQAASAWKRVQWIKTSPESFPKAELLKAQARWQALEDCLDALSGASKR